jgi:hypothetical protein
MSTLISELESAPALGDGDFVQSILADMNGGQGASPVQPPPAIQAQAPMMNSPGPNTIAPHVMDNGPATAHIIGNTHPTPGDFARVMAGGGGSAAPSAATQPTAAPQGGAWGAGLANYQAGPVRAPMYIPAKKSWLARTLEQFRVPILVAILVFVFSLPVVNFLFAHYLPSMVKSTGELTFVGLVIKSVGAGLSYWSLQQVIVPLLSL